MLQWLSQHLARLLVLLVAIGGGAYLAFEWFTRPPDALTELRQANPAWTAVQPRHGGLHLSDGSGVDVFVNSDHAGALRLRRLDCAQVMPSLPTWLRLPPGSPGGCLQMGNAAPFTLVLNHRTAVPIPELWTRHYEPHLDELSLPYWGGSIGGGSASATSARKFRSMSYSVDPAPGANLQVNLMAFYMDDETMLVVTLRPLAVP